MKDDTLRNTTAAGLYLIHDAGLEPETIEQLSELADIIFVPWAERDNPRPLARVLLYLGDEAIRDLALQALEQQWGVGILPHPEASRAMAAMGVKGEILAVCDHYLNAPVIGADALTCNGELVFSSVVPGLALIHI